MNQDLAFLLIGDTAAKLFGLSGRTRLERILARAGLTRAVERNDALSWKGPVILVRADYVFDEGLIKALINSPGTALVADQVSGVIVAAYSLPGNHGEALALLDGRSTPPSERFSVMDPIALASSYNHALRKRARPLLIRAETERAPEIERLLFNSAYKGVTDFVTKHVWPIPALGLTRWCAARGISPNQVTLISAVFVLLAMWLFWHGQFLAGLAAAWMMCFLDTVDGKLARVTLTSTRWGNAFDHGIDLLHPPFWYYAWFIGLGARASDLSWALWVIIIGYVVGRLQEGLFIWLFKIEIHTWRPIDSWFRQITARRNPNLFILMLASIAGHPATGFALVAYWTLASLVFHFTRIFQAWWLMHRGARPRSWLTEPMEPRAT